MKLVVDENITLAEEAFASFGDLLLINGRKITNEILRDADVLIVRSITNINKELLNGTTVKLIGTATIGTDHIDTEYLSREGIKFSDAKGCNANSVAEYVMAALMRIAVKENLSFKNKSIGVIGVGNVGGRIVKYAEALGLEVLKNDPPKERENIGSDYSKLEDVLNADIVTLHVPLNLKGIDKSLYLLNEYNLRSMKQGAILINTSRGSVIENDALKNIIDKKEFKVVLDVWEGEPLINTGLLEKVKLGTAHIAGYSLEGKVNGTKMIYDSLRKFKNSKSDWVPNLPEVHDNEIEMPSEGTDEEKLNFIFNQIYDISYDDSLLRKLLSIKEDDRITHFDKLRKAYPVRREFGNYTIKSENDDRDFNNLLRSLGFKLNLSG
ncbi:MAG: 4-phosphoerythronate dehydrogenase [Ignavibacterium sp.]|nr:MAG: 4-phosphoerythronate dehydrogenase [Ignavibacterium sp.]